MMPKEIAVAVFMVGMVAGTMSGCGLVNSDIGTVKYALPSRTYSFDTSPWMLPSGTLPSVPCSAATDCCMAAAAFSYSCTTQPPLSCASGTCSISKTIENVPQVVNLMMESGISNQSVADISISEITYEVNSNTLNVELPSVGLFLAPLDVTTTTDPMAQRFGTVPKIAAGSKEPGRVMIDGAGNAAFTRYAHNLSTSFNFLSSTTVTVGGGSPFPMGTVDIKVSGFLAVKPSL